MHDRFLERIQKIQLLEKARKAFERIKVSEYASDPYTRMCWVLQIEENLFKAGMGFEALDKTGQLSAEEIRGQIKDNIARIALINALCILKSLEQTPEISRYTSGLISVIREEFEAAGKTPDKPIEERLENVRNRVGQPSRQPS